MRLRGLIRVSRLVCNARTKKRPQCGPNTGAAGRSVSKIDIEGKPIILPDLTITPLSRSLQLAGEPAARIGLHRILRYADRMNVAALLALERAVIESVRSGHDFGKQHPRLRAFRAMRPLDGGKRHRR